MSYFADLAEHMTATLTTLPKKLWAEFDGIQMMVTGTPNLGTEMILAPGFDDSPTPKDLSRPVRISTLSDLTHMPANKSGFFGFSLRTATVHDLRAGRPPFLSTRRHLRFAMATIKPYSGKGSTWTRGFVGWDDKSGMWLRWGLGVRLEPDRELHDRVSMLVSLQFSQRYNWTAYLRAFEGTPRLAIACSAQDGRKLFRARDLPPGKTRRDALRHWVTEHYRNADTPIGVRSHFRGQDTFDWRQLQCELAPSEYDRDRVGQLPTPCRPSASPSNQGA